MIKLWFALFPWLLAGAALSHAATISFTGDLRADAAFTTCGTGCTLGPGDSDGDYAQWAAVERTFSVATSSAVRAITFSYGGGTNEGGTVIAPNGFEPYLSLFDGSGNFLASTLFGTTCPSGANTNAGSGQCFDVELDAGILQPGNYAITISAFENMSFAENAGGGLADGFTGLGNLAFGEDLHYAFDVILQDAAPVPEPGYCALSGLALFAVLTTKKKQ